MAGEFERVSAILDYWYWASFDVLVDAQDISAVFKNCISLGAFFFPRYSLAMWLRILLRTNSGFSACTL